MLSTLNLRIFCFLLIASAIHFFSTPSWAFSIPTNLKNKDLSTLSNTLGFSTSNKFLTNPYPLGGFSGLEIGLGAEFIDVVDLANLGNGTPDQSTLEIDRLSIGKGLFGNIDVFLNFVPLSNSSEVSSYGSSLKWTFYEAQFLPLTLSVIAHYDSINFHDQFMSENYGADLLAGVNVEHLAFYFGGGTLTGRHAFSKSILDLTDLANSTGITDNRSLINVEHQTHALIGVHTEISSCFVAAEIDRYQGEVYSAKVGFRF
jgi:hypothetical protein